MDDVPFERGTLGVAPAALIVFRRREVLAAKFELA
jgi:hypothetical protein